MKRVILKEEAYFALSHNVANIDLFQKPSILSLISGTMWVQLADFL